jgi:mRNA interferase RelE/StbE
MQVEFLESFYKDLDKILSNRVRASVKNSILKVERAKVLTDLNNIKKLTGYKSAYRIKIGDYRIGLFIEDSKVEFARIVHRKDIYRVFP